LRREKTKFLAKNLYTDDWGPIGPLGAPAYATEVKAEQFKARYVLNVQMS